MLLGYSILQIQLTQVNTKEYSNVPDQRHAYTDLDPRRMTDVTHTCAMNLTKFCPGLTVV